VSVLRLCAAISVLLAGGAAALAQSPEEFYRGKTIDILIGFSAGGGNDSYGRMLANHMGRHIPGRPLMVAKNMPGAGSFLAINTVYGVSPKNGTVIALGAPTLALDERIGTQGVRFKSAELNWLGRVDTQVDILFMSTKSKVKTVDDARTMEAVLSSTGASSASSNYPTVLNNVVGTKFRLILGYRGSNDAILALERGEVEGHSTAWNALKTQRPEWLSKGGVINLFVQFSVNRHPELASVPTAIEFARSERERQVLHAIMNATEIGTAFFTTPGVPEDRLAVLRRAFDATMKDPAFLAEAAKLNFSVGPMVGEEVQKLVAEAATLSPELVKDITAAFVQRAQ
jgi:tripartite-type tricarboxylate transporter receptor subunit TctC